MTVADFNERVIAAFGARCRELLAIEAADALAEFGATAT